MPKYYFHLRDGIDLVIDEEGREMAGAEAITVAALADARSILSSDVLAGKLHFDQRIDVEDEAHSIVHRLHFRDALEVFDAPA